MISKLVKRRDEGEFGYSELARRVSTLLALPMPMSMEAR